MPKLRRGLFSLTMLMILLISCNFICRAEESAEKGPAEIGDILYHYSRRENGEEIWKPGHAMLYVGWYPVREPKKENLRVIESMPPSEINRRGLVNESIDYTYDYARTWKQGLSAEQRRKISEFVISKTGLWRYCEDFDHTYQKGQDGIHCDCVGLCEAAYESIGLNPIWMEWPILWPEQQCISSRMKDAIPVLPEARLALSSTPKGYASDGDYGSGITMVEFWEGEPDDTPEERPGYRIGFDDHDTNVSGYYECEFPPGFELTEQGKIKVFDQAGNWKVGYGEWSPYSFSAVLPTGGWGNTPSPQLKVVYGQYGTTKINLAGTKTWCAGPEWCYAPLLDYEWEIILQPECWAYPTAILHLVATCYIDEPYPRFPCLPCVDEGCRSCWVGGMEYWAEEELYEGGGEKDWTRYWENSTSEKHAIGRTITCITGPHTGQSAKRGVSHFAYTGKWEDGKTGIKGSKYLMTTIYRTPKVATTEICASRCDDDPKAYWVNTDAPYVDWGPGGGMRWSEICERICTDYPAYPYVIYGWEDPASGQPTNNRAGPWQDP